MTINLAVGYLWQYHNVHRIALVISFVTVVALVPWRRGVLYYCMVLGQIELETKENCGKIWESSASNYASQYAFGKFWANLIVLDIL